MYKGFYNLASGVLTHQRNLDVIANNMVNVSTPGFKQDRYTATTFDEVMYSRVGNKDSIGTEIGGQSYIRATSDVETDFTQGTMEPTGLPLDLTGQSDNSELTNNSITRLDGMLPSNEFDYFLMTENLVEWLYKRYGTPLMDLREFLTPAELTKYADRLRYTNSGIPVAIDISDSPLLLTFGEFYL